ncbi:GDP-L-fucose synthase family protein [Desulfosarcina ovata]|uniref:GDP-L-fucose synthase n=1 Tax=Desulfosarcina ovata subsp. ovata TaxID=2752305 RepID=A0A5K8AJJ6_9BACT|nr:GDP-L-fucose synthase [Desulfosarcina ovata]BBO92883.1 GDP-L-fucose synthase [Desulfosarcina ovata subsp. ovata]
MNKSSKIFIAGAAGMVGSAIVRKLLSMGYTNLCGSYHSRKPGGDKLLTGSLEALQSVKLDLTNQSAVERFFADEKPAYVFLAAARVGGIHANNTYPAQFIYDNLTIQGNVIHAAYQAGVERLLFLGSSCIYPKMAPQPMKEEHFLTGLIEPTNEPYAIAKIAGIKMCESYNRQYGTRFMAVMPTNLYGINDNFNLENSHVLPALIRKFHLAKLAFESDWDGIQKDEACFGTIPDDIKASLGIHGVSGPTSTSSSALRPQHSPDLPPAAVTIWGTGSPKREFLDVDDMAGACVHIMNLDEKTAADELLNYPRPCFVNLGTGVDCTIHALASTVRDVVGYKGEIVYDRTKPDGTPQKLLDVSRLSGLGWRASINLVDGIRRTYQWYLGQY